MDLFDEDELKRPMWPLRRPPMELHNRNFKRKKNIDLKRPRQLKKVRRYVKPLINGETNVDRDESSDEGSNDQNDDLYEISVFDNIKF